MTHRLPATPLLFALLLTVTSGCADLPLADEDRIAVTVPGGSVAGITGEPGAVCPPGATVHLYNPDQLWAGFREFEVREDGSFEMWIISDLEDTLRLVVFHEGQHSQVIDLPADPSAPPAQEVCVRPEAPAVDLENGVGTIVLENRCSEPAVSEVDTSRGNISIERRPVLIPAGGRFGYEIRSALESDEHGLVRIDVGVGDEVFTHTVSVFAPERN